MVLLEAGEVAALARILFLDCRKLLAIRVPQVVPIVSVGRTLAAVGIVSRQLVVVESLVASGVCKFDDLSVLRLIWRLKVFDLLLVKCHLLLSLAVEVFLQRCRAIVEGNGATVLGLCLTESAHEIDTTAGTNRLVKTTTESCRLLMCLKYVD